MNIHIKKILSSIILLLSLFMFAVSCGNGVLKPDEYSKNSIDNDYPHFKIGLSNFQISKGNGVFGEPAFSKYTVITAEEKRRIVEGLAMMRLVVNTREFKDAVLAMTNLASARNDSYNNASITNGYRYDSKILLKTIEMFEKDLIYQKDPLGGGASAAGDVGKDPYVRYKGGMPEEDIKKGMQPRSFLYGGKWGNYGDLYLIFHEHIHNIGYTHGDLKGGDDVAYTVQVPFSHVLNGILGQGKADPKYSHLKEKYKKDLDRLIAYYVDRYKHLISYNTVYDPNAQTDKK